ncbi:DnaJ C-terminal domain-containing protein [Zavarzinia sp. CC-PAN008]|uniref:DnaJ C-terminal domain-containing protein n=1 Tax=Zavarzinia sp. CC-PAN008 TaxID=3243332 RepID=UPI003F749B3D
MFEPYSILGVARDISDADLKRAYRKRAKELHPDLHPGDPAIAERFKEVAAAYSLLGDPIMRARYDRGEIDGWGNHIEQEEPPKAKADGATRKSGAQGGTRADAPPRGKAEGEPPPRHEGPGVKFGRSQDDVISDLLAKMRARKESQSPGQAKRTRGADRSYSLTIGFLDSINGTVKSIERPDGGFRVTIPAGTMSGEIIRLSGKGEPGPGPALAGDALVEIAVEPHPVFSRRGDDILVDLPVTLYEAVLGAKVVAPTIDGPVSLTIPPWSNGGTVLRLRGKGVPDDVLKTRGDQLVTLRLMLPDEHDATIQALAKDLADRHPYEVRGRMAR